MNKKTAVIVPVYNEAQNLKILIPKILNYIEGVIIIIVDDNSTDDTKDVIAGFDNKNQILHLLRSKKMGRGTAVMHGFSYAFKKTNIEIFVEMDADLSHDPKELPGLIGKVDNKSISIASRYIKGSKIINSPPVRKLLSQLANLLNSFLFGLPIKDNTNGFRAYPRTAIQILLKHKYKSTGFVTISESTYALFRKGFRVNESKTRFVNRRLGKSKANFHEIYISIKDLIRIRFLS